MDWQELGKLWVNGYKIEEIDLGGKHFKFNPTQSAFINDLKHRYVLNEGGFGSGKSLALNIKLVLFTQCFPNSTILLGRKTLSDLDRTTLPELFKLFSGIKYEHRVKEGLIRFPNGSLIILFGLDALQSGDMGDIKKAQQKIKSLNLSSYFIDQLEEIEYDVFDALNSRLRNMDIPFRQGNMTCNPANFWAYHFFIKKFTKVKDNWIDKGDNNSIYFKSSMLDNKEFLPDDYLKDQLNHDAAWVKRYVYGDWDSDLFSGNTVFAGEYISKWRAKQPVEVREECDIYEKYIPGQIYRIGVDPSDGVVDPSSITVISGDGKKVAKYNGYTTPTGTADKVKFLYYNYGKPLIIPEVNDKAGGTLLEIIKDLRIYKRQTFEYKETIPTEKLGFKCNHSTKRMLISNFQDLLRNGFPKIYDQKTIDEFKTFTWSDEARKQGAGAERGFHDDDVISTLLAFWEFTPKRVDYLIANETKPIIKRKFNYK